LSLMVQLYKDISHLDLRSQFNGNFLKRTRIPRGVDLCDRWLKPFDRENILRRFRPPYGA